MSKVVSRLKQAAFSLVDRNEYARFEEPTHAVTPSNKFAQQSDIEVMGELVMGTGAVIALGGVAVDVLNLGGEQLAQVTVLGGLGGVAVGGVIYGFEKLTNR